MTTKDIQAVQFQTIDFCNRSCSFCPNAHGARKTGNMMLPQVFHTLLRQLEEIEYKGRLSPYLMNEPLMDRRIFDIIRVARDVFDDNTLYLSTNGDMLRGYTLELLQAAGLDLLHINLYDDKTRRKRRREYFEREIHSIPGVEQRQDNTPMRTETLQVYIKDVGESSPEHWNRGGNVQVKARHRKKRCQLPFTQMYINYLGQAVLCCSDYYFEVVMGNIMTEHIADIWMNERYEHYHHHLWKGETQDLTLCKTCNRV